MSDLQYQPIGKCRYVMIYSGIIYSIRTLAARFAGKAPVQKRHQLAAGMVVCGALCFSLLIFRILYNIFPQLENIFDVWYGGICFFAGMLVLTVGWEEFCILLKKWYVAMILSLCVIVGWIIILLQCS